MRIDAWIVVLLLLLALIFGVGSVSTATRIDGPVAAVNPEVEINGNPGVILPAESGENWMPSDEHLQAAEDAVEAETRNSARPPVLDGYRQYIGVVEDGQRKIRINSMCSEADNWRIRLIEVEDGGPCYWGATYNVDTGEIESLVVNGEA